VPARFPAQPPGGGRLRRPASPRHGACRRLRKLSPDVAAADTIIERGNSLKESAVVLSSGDPSAIRNSGIAGRAPVRDDDALGRQTSTIHFDTGFDEPCATFAICDILYPVAGRILCLRRLATSASF